MERNYIYIYIGIYLLWSKSQASSNTTDRTCSSFPDGLSVDGNIVIESSLRWKNQCPSGEMIAGLWSPGPKQLITDMKCCTGPVDQVLAISLFDIKHLENGPSQVDQRWNLQCPDNHVMTGLKIARHSQDNHDHIAGLQCSLLINNKINYNECERLDLSISVGIMRDPSFLWSAECPPSAGLIGFYSTNGFQKITYAKCCKIQDVQPLENLPWTCPIAPQSMCGWSISRDTSLTWNYLSTGGGTAHFLYLSQTASTGSAKILSPGYSAPSTPICFRLTYLIRLYAAIKISMKSYDSKSQAAFDDEIALISRSTSSLAKKDFFITPTSNFQITIEGQRIKSIVSTVWISELAFVPADQCNADRCRSPYEGCAENEICLPNGPQGYKECVCKQGFNRINGKCRSQSIRTDGISTVPVTAATSPIVTTGGSHRGGDGKTDGGGEKKPDSGTSDRGGTGGKTKYSVGQRNNAFQPWVYTAVGGICGTLLVLFLVFAFLTYRKRRLTRQMYRFNLDVNYLRPRSMSGSFISDNNNSYVPEPTIQPYSSDIVSRSVDMELASVPGIEFPDDRASVNSGSPPSHHYFEVEQESTYFDRKTSQTTLVSPMYGSSEDVEDCSCCEKFLEPPSDEQELCAQLDKEIYRKDLDIQEKKLGQGAFGFVHLGIWHRSDGDSKTVAIKSMKNAGAAEERIKFFQEAAIMKQFAHQNVVYMYGVVTKRYPPMIVLEYMKNGNLRKYLSREKRSRLKQGLQRVDRDLHRVFLRMARQIVAGMTYLAGMQFVHRDLAARNILLDENMVCKIGDFGLARDLIGCNHYISQGGQIPVKWTAPEALAFRRYSTASDVWSFGVLLYEIWSVGKKPYENENWSNDEVIENVCNRGFRLPPPKDCPRVIYHLMIDCWHPDEAKRPTFSQIKYCLAQNDERLLGRGVQTRQRSATLNELSCETIKEENYGELQYVYCKTD